MESDERPPLHTMAGEAQFASLDGTALHGESYGSHLRPIDIARRSISIFSRRGTETPEPKPPFIAQAAMRIPKQLGGRPKKWIRRKSAPADANPKAKGTILHAVPPARTIRMTRLEEEMATSPNEEILSAIGSPTTQVSFEWPAPSRQEMDRQWSTNSVPLSQRTLSTCRKERNARIGVWRKGVTHWDDEALREQSTSEEPNLKENTGFSPLRRFPTERLNNPRPVRPVLSVVIPGSELLINDTTLSTIVQSSSRPSVISVAPLSILPRIALTSPTPSIDEFEDMASPVDSPVRPTAPIRANIEGETPTRVKQSRESSSSTISSFVRPDDASESSLRSSATSEDILVGRNSREILKQGSPPVSPDSPSVYSPQSEDFTTPPFDDETTFMARPSPPPLPPRNPPAIPCSLIDSVDTLRFNNESGLVSRDAASPPPLGCKNPLREELRLGMFDHENELEAKRSIASSISFPTTLTPNEAHDDRECKTNSSAFEHGSNLKDISKSDASPPSKSGSIKRQGSVRSVLHPPERAPTIPRRSRKREWIVARKTICPAHLSIRTARRRKSDSHLRSISPENHDLSVLRRSASTAELPLFDDIAQLLQTPIESLLPPTKNAATADAFDRVAQRQNEETADETGATGSAEDVLLQILASLDNIKDLFNTAIINKGMYRVFKENKSDLISAVMYNQSPPAWEFREWSAFDNIESPMSPTRRQCPDDLKMTAHCRDMRVIEALKKLILERCQTVIRRETAFALSTPTHPHAQRFNDAIWRIWCFCKIFGCGKNREEDVTGQLDWLKGGLLAHNQDLSATMNVNLDYEMSSVLLNPPEYFADGNGGGLNARQLYDMTEIWACMNTLLEGFHFRTEQASDNGVFDDCSVGSGDEQTEEQMLEEWTAYLLTLGPKVVLEMAEYANDSSSAGFALARIKGWTKWSQPECNGSRSTFLKEPVSRLYEERVTTTAMNLQNSSEEAKKEMSRNRVATLAAEIKLARQASTYKRLPFIDMNMERSMSPLSRTNSVVSTNSMRSVASISSPLRQCSTSSSRHTTPISPMYTSRSAGFSLPRRKASRRTLWSPRKISPIIEGRVETFNRMALQNYGSGVIPDDAIRYLVDMGFSGSQAREALRMTKSGDGLRVDLALDVLLRAK